MEKHTVKCYLECAINVEYYFKISGKTKPIMKNNKICKHFKTLRVDELNKTKKIKWH